MKELHELHERTARMEQSIFELHKKFDDQKPVVNAVHEHSIEIAKIHRDKKWEKGIFGAAYAFVLAWIEHRTTRG